MDELFSKQVYQGMLVILNDEKYYYKSIVNPSYNHFTDKGKEAMLDYINDMATPMLAREEKDFKDKVKKEVWRELKN